MGKGGVEVYEKFIRLFEMHVQSEGAAMQLWLSVMEGWLDKTPLLVYQQFRRDNPAGNYFGFKKILEKSFGNASQDGRRAIYQLQQMTWKKDQSLLELATEIRDLHFRGHPETPLSEREKYAGDTFIRCLPLEMQMEIRRKGGHMLSQYLQAAE